MELIEYIIQTQDLINPVVIETADYKYRHHFPIKIKQIPLQH